MQKAFESIKMSQSLIGEFGDSRKDPESKQISLKSVELTIPTKNTQVQLDNSSNVICNNVEEKSLSISESSTNPSSKRIVDKDEVRVMQKVLGNEVSYKYIC